MLRRDGEPQQGSCADQARAARAVPEDHVVRRMRRAVDWAAELVGEDDQSLGRPSWPPAVRLRMLVLEQCADLSDREVHEPVGSTLLYRALVGLGVDDPVPDDTTRVRFRARVGEAGIRAVFERLNQQWAPAGLIGTDRRVLDGVHRWAKVARRSWVCLLRTGRAVGVEAGAPVDPARAEAWPADYAPAAEERGPRGEEALRIEGERTTRLLEAVADLTDAQVQARLAQVRTLLAGEGDRVVSFDDPDAGWGHKAPDKPFLGYKPHEALDPASRLITAVDVVPGNAIEAVKTDAVLRTESPPRPEGVVVIGDGLYNNATTVAQVEQAQARPCFSGLKAERVSDGFDDDAGADQLVCPEGKRSIGTGRGDNGDLSDFSRSDCNVCPRQSQCLTPGEREGKAEPRRRVYMSDVRKRKGVEGEAGKAWRQGHLKVRGRIEPKFDEQMNRHGLRRVRDWGRAKVTMQVLLNVITVNAKRTVKLLAQAGRLPEAGRRPAEATT